MISSLIVVPMDHNIFKGVYYYDMNNKTFFFENKIEGFELEIIKDNNNKYVNIISVLKNNVSVLIENNKFENNIVNNLVNDSADITESNKEVNYII
jgi:hypothetical protein